MLLKCLFKVCSLFQWGPHYGDTLTLVLGIFCISLLYLSAEISIHIMFCCSVGDAVCTISSATCFPEPFISEGRRLGYVHRNFAGNRFSDHVALLSVFQAWDDAR